MITEPIGPCPRCKIVHGPDDPRLCARCGHVHDPARCPRHAKDPDGVKRPCRKYPRANQAVCESHGGDAPRSLAAAERRGEVERAEKVLATMGRPVRVVSNPLAELSQLLGELLGWKDHVAAMVERLESFTVGEMAVPRGEVTLLLQFFDRCDRVAANIGKLNIDERLAAATEGQLRSTQALFPLGLGAYNEALGLSAEQVSRVPAAAEAARAAIAAEVERRLAIGGGP